MANSSGGGPTRGGRWSYWLLLIVIPLTMFVPLYNRVDPTLFGFPFFYWFQLAMIFVGAALTALAYFVTERE
jgi:Protein of unknown function (DUF3311)